MRQQHKAGEKLFIDYCGPTMNIIDPTTGEVKTAQIFVAVMGASNYTYAEATWNHNRTGRLGNEPRSLFHLFRWRTRALNPRQFKKRYNQSLPL